MRAESVIEAVVNAGGELTISGDRVRYRLPKDHPERERLLSDLREHRDEIAEALRERAAIPTIPPGVRLVRWEPKPAPVVLTAYAVVTDVPRFISMTLLELKGALAGERWRAGHRSARELVDRLEQCGVCVEIDVSREKQG